MKTLTIGQWVQTVLAGIPWYMYLLAIAGWYLIIKDTLKFIVRKICGYRKTVYKVPQTNKARIQTKDILRLQVIKRKIKMIWKKLAVPAGNVILPTDQFVMPHQNTVQSSVLPMPDEQPKIESVETAIRSSPSNPVS